MLRARFSLWNSREDYLILTLGYFKGCMTFNPKHLAQSISAQNCSTMNLGSKFLCLEIRSWNDLTPSPLDHLWVGFDPEEISTRILPDITSGLEVWQIFKIRIVRNVFPPDAGLSTLFFRLNFFFKIISCLFIWSSNFWHLICVKSYENW